MIEVQKTTLDMAGSSRLEQIRASMAGEQLTAGSSAPAIARRRRVTTPAWRGLTRFAKARRTRIPQRADPLAEVASW